MPIFKTVARQLFDFHNFPPRGFLRTFRMLWRTYSRCQNSRNSFCCNLFKVDPLFFIKCLYYNPPHVHKGMPHKAPMKSILCKQTLTACNGSIQDFLQLVGVHLAVIPHHFPERLPGRLRLLGILISILRKVLVLLGQEYTTSYYGTRDCVFTIGKATLVTTIII